MAKTHFVSTFQQYVDAVTLQAQDRDSNRIRSIDEFWAVRDHTGGCLPSFCFVEFFVDFPEEVYRHPMLERIREIANRSIAGCNVCLSFLKVPHLAYLPPRERKPGVSFYRLTFFSFPPLPSIPTLPTSLPLCYNVCHTDAGKKKGRLLIQH